MSQTFGQWLKQQRVGRALTLRDVESITEGRVSNAYLSQLETGKIANPSVVILHSISAALAVDFGELCERACVGQTVAAPTFCECCGQIIRDPAPPPPRSLP